MNNLTLYKNMKRWLFVYGKNLLDLLLPAVDETKDDPLERYEDLNKLFDLHFNLLSYFGVQVQPNLPVILVSFDDLTKNSCFAKIRMQFDVYFQIISPPDCKDSNIIITNSPEAILEYVELMNEALCEMMYNMGKDLQGKTFEGVPWEYPLNYSVIGATFGSSSSVSDKEILHFQSSFTLSDNLSIC